MISVPFVLFCSWVIIVAWLLRTQVEVLPCLKDSEDGFLASRIE